MIELLRIKNLALIADVEMEFAQGLNVLTGETGAGKTFILKALEFLTGERLSADMVRHGARKALVEALFVLDGREIILRRELSGETGRARIFLDGQLATQEVVRELKPRLILHASQNGQQKLLSPAFQARLLDHVLPEPGLLERRDALVRRTAAVTRDLVDLRERMHHLEERREVLEMQRAEIDKTAPREGEEEDLVERQKGLREARKAREAVDAALALLLGDDGLVGGMGRLERELAVLDQVGGHFAQDLETSRDMRLTLSELAARLRQGLPEAEGDPEAVEARLWELSQLKRKLKRSLPEILGLAREIEENLNFLDSAGLDCKRLERARREHREELAQVLERLDACRRETALALAGRIEEELRGLGFSEHVRVLYDFSPVEVFAAEDGLPAVTEQGARLLFAPNPGQPPQPLDRIASGGELSRFLLALTSLRAESERLTLIFDEVDAGIGGLTLTRVGERLRALTADHQMLLITHWPQLAALAERHFLVSKHVQDGQTETTCSLLEGDALRQELARMAGGSGLGEALAGKLLDSRN